MSALIDDIEVAAVRGDPASTEVLGVDLDSRRVRPGWLFCCVPGAHTDGHRHVAEAVDNGASCLLCEEFLDLEVTQVGVAPGSVRPAMAKVAAAFHGRPSEAMCMVGVTGTNGKTTVTHLVASILAASGSETGVLGTLDGERTTPEAPVLQSRLAGLRDSGCQAVAMEVSSHGLAEHRVDGIVFDVAAFTNLSRDHLDHHRSMEEYFAAKSSLFDRSRSKRAVINVDDPWGRRLADAPLGIEVVPVRRTDATDVVLSVGRTSFRWRDRMITTALSGMFNVENALVAATVATALGVGPDVVEEGLAAATPVPGRMEVVRPGLPVAVLVDYAHTPAGLEAALTAARQLAGAGRVVCVFGCGGDRDRGKRTEMGAAASQWSDLVVLTSDNPRSEDPLAIIDQVRGGMTDTATTVIEPDRTQAIGMAVDLAVPGDVVVIAGKGHETTQVVGDRSVPFDDRRVATDALAARFGTAGSASAEPAESARP
jgi:UDP-N-acetylmuramoyl-L-alanyl-D-glutamate--2,6-diaminopimelate ligase